MRIRNYILSDVHAVGKASGITSFLTRKSRSTAGLICALAFGIVTSSARADGERTPVGLQLTRSAHGVDVNVVGRFTVPTYSVRSRDEGRTVVVDVDGATLPESGFTLPSAQGIVREINASSTARGVRVELSLSSAATYRARAESNGIRVSLEEVSAETEEEPAVAPTGPVSVRSVSLERRDGRDRVIIELSRPAEFRVAPGNEGPAKLEIPSATLASLPPLASPVEGSVIRGVRVYRGEGRAVVEVERASPTSTTAVREGNRIVWMFAAPEPTTTRPPSRILAREAPVADASETGDELVETGEVAGFLTDVPLQVSAARGARRFTGRRIDLDFKDADLLHILRLLAEVGGVNIVAGDDVDGQVTIRMRNVPWDQALDVILQAKGLGLVRRTNLIRVAPLAVLEKERELAIARRKQNELLASLETRIVPVSYARAEDLAARARELLSSRGTVSVDARTNVLIARDVVENLEDVEALVRNLDTQTPQVLVEARIVEASSQYARDVGIQWGGDVTLNSATGNPTGLVFPSDLSVIGGNYDGDTPSQGLSPFAARVPVPNFAVNLPATVGTGQGGALGLSLGSLGGAVNLSVRLSAAEANGTLRIVSSPRILTLDNAEAHIAQGTLIPYSQVSAQGVQTAFQEAKLELRVRPHVTSDGSVAMHVKVTRDEPDFTRTSNRGDPTILKREAETDLLVPDGHTAVIGGIYSRTTGHNINQIPFFGDIPILGALFQRRRVTDSRSELLIFLTPRIVNRDESIRN